MKISEWNCENSRWSGALPDGPAKCRRGIPCDISRVVEKALDPNADMRFATAGDFANALAPCRREAGFLMRLVGRLTNRA